MLCRFQMYQWLESKADAELYTLTELHANMIEFSNGSDVYTPKRLKQKLHEYYNKIPYSLQKLRGEVLFYALQTWQVILSMTNGTLKERKT